MSESYRDSWLYPQSAYQFGSSPYFIVYQTWHEKWGKFDFPIVFTHESQLSRNPRVGISSFYQDRIQSSRFTGNCGIRTLEYANWYTTPLLIERASLWLRHYCGLGFLVASDYIEGPTSKILRGWEENESVPNPNMGTTNPNYGPIHPIHIKWKDVVNLDTSEVLTWRAVPIPSEPEKPSSPAGIFAETSGSTIPISPSPSPAIVPSNARSSRSPRTAVSRRSHIREETQPSSQSSNPSYSTYADPGSW